MVVARIPRMSHFVSHSFERVLDRGANLVPGMEVVFWRHHDFEFPTFIFDP